MDTIANITCNHCSQHIEYDGEYADVTIPCPTCSKELFLPKVEPNVLPKAMSMQAPPIIPTYRKPKHCVNCLGQELKAVPFVWEQGMSLGTTKTNGIGVGMGLGIAIGTARSNTINVSYLAQRIRPPKLPSYAVVGWMIFIFMTLYSMFQSSVIIFVIGIGLAGLATATLPTLHWKNHQSKMMLWQNSWICMDCGTVSYKLG